MVVLQTRAVLRFCGYVRLVDVVNLRITLI